MPFWWKEWQELARHQTNYGEWRRLEGQTRKTVKVKSCVPLACCSCWGRVTRETFQSHGGQRGPSREQFYAAKAECGTVVQGEFCQRLLNACAHESIFSELLDTLGEEEEAQNSTIWATHPNMLTRCVFAEILIYQGVYRVWPSQNGKRGEHVLSMQHSTAAIQEAASPKVSFGMVAQSFGSHITFLFVKGREQPTCLKHSAEGSEWVHLWHLILSLKNTPTTCKRLAKKYATCIILPGCWLSKDGIWEDKQSPLALCKGTREKSVLSSFTICFSS